MIIDIETKKFKQLTPYELKRCKKLNKGSRGLMRDLLKIEAQDKRSRIILAKHRRRVVGWGLITPEADPTWFDLELNVYVEQAHRKRGIGGFILERAALIIRRRKAKCWMWRGSKCADGLYKSIDEYGRRDG